VLRFKRLLGFIGLLEFIGFTNLLISASPLQAISLSIFSDSAFRKLEVTSSPHFDLFCPPVLRHLPDNALSSKFAVEFWIKALAAMINVETFAALLTKPRFVLLTNSDRLPVRMDSALHLVFSHTRS
jgi:hypothetical protein